MEIVSFEKNELPKLIPETYDDVIAFLKPNDDVITLSDDEVSIKDDNYVINIKVLWRSKRIDRLSMHRVCIFIINL